MWSSTWSGGDAQKRSFLVLKEGGHLVSATRPVSHEETARHRFSGAMMRLAPSSDVLGKIARLLEEGTIRPDVANVYAHQNAAQAWTDITANPPDRRGKTQVTWQDRASCGLELLIMDRIRGLLEWDRRGGQEAH